MAGKDVFVNLLKNKRSLVVILVLILSIGILLFVSKPNHPHGRTYVSEEERRHGPCPGKTELIEVDGKKFSLLTNWYACHPVGRGDLVYFSFSDSHDPVARVARGIPGDKFKLTVDKAHDAWNLKIDDEFVEDMEGKPHFFGSKAPPLLSLYEKQMAKTGLPEKNFIVFSEGSPGSFDSGSLGVVSSDDFIGKLQPSH